MVIYGFCIVIDRISDENKFNMKNFVANSDPISSMLWNKRKLNSLQAVNKNKFLIWLLFTPTYHGYA